MLFKQDWMRRLKHLEKLKVQYSDSRLDEDIEWAKKQLETAPEDTLEVIEQIRAQRLERAKRKAARQLQWAESRERKANQAGEQAHRMAGVIPFGQPILVGHHSERRDRAYRDRIRQKYTQESEHQKMANYHKQKAENILRFGARVRGDAERERQAKREEMDKQVRVGSEVFDFCFKHGVVVRVNKKTYTITFDSGGTWARDKTYVKFVR